MLSSPKPKRLNSKAKGGAFEARVAKMLSAALPLNFIKSPGSGARVGGQNFATVGKMMGEEALKLFTADVVPVNESQVGKRFKFSIECKCYANQDTFAQLMAGGANLFKWFDESVVDSAKVGRLPMLIFKWNATKIFVATQAGMMPVEPVLTMSSKHHHAGKMPLDLHFLEDLLEHPDLWTE